MSWLQLSRLWHASWRVRILVLLFMFGVKWLCTAAVRRLNLFCSLWYQVAMHAAGSNTFGIKWLCIAVGSDTCNVAQIWFEVAMHRGGSNTCTVVHLWYQVAMHCGGSYHQLHWVSCLSSMKGCSHGSKLPLESHHCVQVTATLQWCPYGGRGLLAFHQSSLLVSHRS